MRLGFIATSLRFWQLLSMATVAICASYGLAEPASPASGRWRTEELDEATRASLKQMERFLAAPGALVVSEVEGLVGPEFKCGALWPAKLDVAYQSGSLRVLRGDLPPELGASSRAGPAGLVAAVGEWRRSLGVEGSARAKLKQFKITAPKGGAFATRIHVELSMVGDAGGVQANAVWNCSWEIAAGEAREPRLKSIRVERYEESHSSTAGGPLFEDVTAAALGINPCFETQILPGIDHWVPRITKLHRFWKFGWHGVAVGDVNGDGLDDVYMSEAGGLPNRLFVQNADGSATDFSKRAGVDWLESTSAALFVDLDNDGDQDLVAATKPMTLFMENDGAGHFKLRTGLYVVEDPFSLSAADYDADGDLDVYVCGYNREDSERNIVAPVPYHDANNGGRSVLFRNDGDFVFADASRESGLEEHNNTRFSLACAWEDYDNDGDPDLYVANDYGRNNLYRNSGGQFTDVADAAGVEDISSGMSITWGDYDRDGRMDAYVSNMFSAAGNRVTYQRKFAAERAGGDLAQIRRMARGNSLFKNRGDAFVDVSESSRTMMGRWAWASLFGDLNNDGWEDLAVCNGFITSERADDL